MGRGSNPIGLNYSSELEFCKDMGFKKRSFQCILLLVLKDSNFYLPLAMGQGFACEGKSFLPTVYCSWLVCRIPRG